MNASKKHQYIKDMVSEVGNAFTGDIPTDKISGRAVPRVIVKYYARDMDLNQVN
jgi:hypothetical protein